VHKAILDHTATSYGAEFENLFISISGSRETALDVSRDLGETVIRLGINIDLRTMQNTIHQVFMS